MAEETRKVFISYKYKDTDVAPLEGAKPSEDTDNKVTPRHYVDRVIELLEDTHIFKGELDGNDLSQFSDDTIDSKLKERIFDSSRVAP